MTLVILTVRGGAVAGGDRGQRRGRQVQHDPEIL